MRVWSTEAYNMSGVLFNVGNFRAAMGRRLLDRLKFVSTFVAALLKFTIVYSVPSSPIETCSNDFKTILKTRIYGSSSNMKDRGHNHIVFGQGWYNN